MVHRPELLNALEDATSGPASLTAWRHMFGGHPPDQENNRGARWNPSGVAAIYLSCDRAGAIAEGDHAIALQLFRPRARRMIYEIELTLKSAVDLSEPDTLHGAGVTMQDVANDDLTVCQELGAAVAWLGNDGLFVPSARSASTNLVVYPSERSVDAVFTYGDGEEII